MDTRRTWQRTALLAMALALMSACTVLAPIQTGEALIGQPASALEARFGKPPERYPRADGGTRWLYPTQPYGQFTYAADLDASGKLVSFRQILTTMDFAQIRVDTSTQKDVLQTFGKPEETTYFRLMDRQVWSYRFKHEGVWPSLMNFYFDRDGVVRLTQVSPDPMYDHDHDSNR
ncbi:putative transmembrane protein [Ralstonia insidiosa]|uniref:Transmembrane protein n=2 Tax=Burkholderiaceae TaxID=119060 RepID=A0AAC9FR96_9RALS|nr:putative transmembrane protein [Ralstonia insidiosa]EPX97418.1 membrane protein [Ralstonia sp. AU12-08]GAQ31348.1 hypothetical protein SAMD00023378_5031 [Ralstonia sp. NT80]